MNNNIRLPQNAAKALQDVDGKIAVIKAVRERLGIGLPAALRMLGANVIEIDPWVPRPVARELLTFIRKYLPAADFQEQAAGDPEDRADQPDLKKAKAMIRNVLEQIMVIEGPTGDLREGERVAVVRGNLVSMHDKLMDALNELSK